MRIAVMPGSFDPVTNGHVDIAERAAGLFDKVYVAVMINSSKSPCFTHEERVELLKKSLTHLGNVEVVSFTGLLVDFVRKMDACAIVKGLRAVSDFEYEFQLALINRGISDNTVETVFLATRSEYMFLSSSVVREVARYHGDISAFVPEPVREDIIRKFAEENK